MFYFSEVYLICLIMAVKSAFQVRQPDSTIKTLWETLLYIIQCVDN